VEQMTVERLQALLEGAFPDGVVKVWDLTGTSDPFGVDVVSPSFQGKSLIEQHKLVHRACGEHLTQAIHALQIKTRPA
jgi:stress-induced morphogen